MTSFVTVLTSARRFGIRTVVLVREDCIVPFPQEDAALLGGRGLVELYLAEVGAGNGTFDVIAVEVGDFSENFLAGGFYVKAKLVLRNKWKRK